MSGTGRPGVSGDGRTGHNGTEGLPFPLSPFLGRDHGDSRRTPSLVDKPSSTGKATLEGEGV